MMNWNRAVVVRASAVRIPVSVGATGAAHIQVAGWHPSRLSVWFKHLSNKRPPPLPARSHQVKIIFTFMLLTYNLVSIKQEVSC